MLSIKDRILAAQKEACDESAGLQKGLDEMIEHRSDGDLYYLDRIWVPLKGDLSIKDRILAAQKEACDESAGLQKGLDEMIEHRSDGDLYYLDRIWVPLKGDVRTLIMDEAYKSKYFVHPGADKLYYDLKDKY
nr:putative reverse transcriptase domain-containing protein [Tanacetum cinerariifolium]